MATKKRQMTMGFRKGTHSPIQKRVTEGFHEETQGPIKIRMAMSLHEETSGPIQKGMTMSFQEGSTWTSPNTNDQMLPRGNIGVHKKKK